MNGCKSLFPRVLGAAAVLALILPRLALGEFGVCPPYSKTFGPDDPPEAILTSLSEFDARPGGGTLILEPGNYSGLESVTIAGVVCIRRADGPEDAPYANISGGSSGMWTVAHGGMLTVAQLNVGPEVVVENGATLFADRIMLSGADDAYCCNDEGRPSLRIEMGGFAHLDGSTVGGMGNSGALVAFDSVFDGGFPYYSGEGDQVYGTEGGRPSLRNDGYAILDQVSVRGALPAFKQTGDPSGIDNTGVISIVGSTVSDNGGCDWYVGGCGGVGVRNSGFVEISRSIVANNYLEECVGTVLDLGYNVFEAGGGCIVTEPTSIEADPLIGPDQELMSGSPAIDRAPLGLCRPTDRLGRARTDGNGDGIVACDSGALEYGYGFVEATVRARPYHWKEVGTIDLSVTDLMTIYVLSTETFDATQIDFDTVEIEGFEDDAKGWPWTIDVGKDGLVDYQVTWWLNRQPPLPCGYQEHEFSAMTVDGTLVRGLLKFEAVGCTP